MSLSGVVQSWSDTQVVALVAPGAASGSARILQNGLGICYAMQGKMPEAERQFREAIRLNPEYAGAQSNLANALGAQNRLAEAIPHYQKALQITPNDFQTHYNFGLTLARQGQRAEAKAQFTEALRLHPDYPEARDALAGVESPSGPNK